MAITRTPMVDDDGTGTTGTIINNAWKQEFYDQIDALVAANMGVWVDIPYSAANFTGSGPMIWTVPSSGVTTFAYARIGNCVEVQFWIGGTSVTGSPSTPLYIRTPFTPVRHTQILCYGESGAAPVTVRCLASAGDPRLSFYRLDGGAWALGDAAMSGQILMFI